MRLLASRAACKRTFHEMSSDSKSSGNSVSDGADTGARMQPPLMMVAYEDIDSAGRTANLDAEPPTKRARVRDLALPGDGQERSLMPTLHMAPPLLAGHLGGPPPRLAYDWRNQVSVPLC